MNESQDVTCEACGATVKARGIKPHQRGCRAYQDIKAAGGVTPIIDATPPKPQPAAAVTNSAAVAAAIAGAGTATAAAVESAAVPPGGHAAAGKYVEPKAKPSRNDDGPPLRPAEKLDELSQRLGAETFRAGTENRFAWCREYAEGPRHTFSRMYFEQRVLVDVYPTRMKGVENEVRQKAAIIAARNEQVAHAERWGYFAVVRDENKPTDETLMRALAGECIVLEPKDVVAARRQANVPRVANGLPEIAAAV
jgi:hypothetical protein